ncbi:MAG: GNAT family N-acetyltransferase [Myxococcales bacterium]|nr:GNAT family N-acetyltransferase [Myxococcales bacterium]
MRLEPLVPAHAGELLGGLQDSDLYEYIADTPPVGIEALRARYERLAGRRSPDGRQQWLNWAIWSGADRAYVGYVQATLEAGDAQLAYVVFRPFWGRGHGRAAVAEMMRLLRAEFGVRRFGARVDVRNLRSRALLEALGFRCVAIHPEAEVIRGRPSDDAEYRLEDQPT